VAYLEGPTLRVVAGTGDPSTDRLQRRRAAAVTPAWLPHSDRVLAYVTAGGAIETIDVLSGRTLWQSPAGASGMPLALAWSRNARRLVALSPGSLTVFGRGGRTLRTITLSATGLALALHPSGRRAAVVVGSQRGGRVLDVSLADGKSSVRFQGDVDGAAWSRDGRHLLLSWRNADQWLVFGPGDRVRALHGVSRELGTAGGFPRVVAWCCPG
jgi:hypothetical protein